MSETTGQPKVGASYQVAKPVPARPAGIAQTAGETQCSIITVLAPSGQTVHVRIIPREPRQSGDEAKTG